MVGSNRDAAWTDCAEKQWQASRGRLSWRPLSFQTNTKSRYPRPICGATGSRWRPSRCLIWLTFTMHSFANNIGQYESWFPSLGIRRSLLFEPWVPACEFRGFTISPFDFRLVKRQADSLGEITCQCWPHLHQPRSIHSVRNVLRSRVSNLSNPIWKIHARHGTFLSAKNVVCRVPIWLIAKGRQRGIESRDVIPLWR